MADDINFESFDNLDDLDWTELEKDLQEEGPAAAQAQSPPPDAGEAAPVAAPSAPSAGVAASQAGRVGTGSTKQVEIGYLLDVNLSVTVEVGKTYSFISNVLGWDRGSIIELDKVVGEPLNMLVNNKPVAKGEVVVVNEKFAVKITEILDPKDRLNYLQS